MTSLQSTQTVLATDYTTSRPAVRKLYDRGKVAAWDPADITWAPTVSFGEQLEDGFAGLDFGAPGSPLAHLDNETRSALGWEFQTWMVSQFLHGEQAALLAAAHLVETVPDLDAKMYAASQAADEARHLDAFSRYALERLPHIYGPSRELVALLDDITNGGPWDMTYLGMQILVEGLALAAFGFVKLVSPDPTLVEIVDYVIRDEARHVAFGVLALQGLYREMDAGDLRDREDFLLESVNLLHDRFLLEDVWERAGVPTDAGKEFTRTNPLMLMFRQMLFGKVVPSINRLGLLTPRVAEGFERLNILGFASLPDGSEEVVSHILASA